MRVGPELLFHEGGKVGRSDATPIKKISSYEMIILVLPLITLRWLIRLPQIYQNTIDSDEAEDIENDLDRGKYFSIFEIKGQ